MSQEETVRNLAELAELTAHDLRLQMVVDELHCVMCKANTGHNGIFVENYEGCDADPWWDEGL